MWTFWRSLRIFLILIALLGAIVFGIMDKNKQSTKMEIDPMTKKEMALLPKLSGFIVDEAEIIGKFEEWQITNVLKKVQEVTPENMRLIIFNRVIADGLNEDINPSFAKKLFEFWELKETDAILITSIFNYSNGHVGKRASWHLFAGKRVDHYFAKNSTDIIIFELKRYFMHGRIERSFLSAMSILLDRVNLLKSNTLSEDHFSSKNLSPELTFWEKFNPLTWFGFKELTLKVVIPLLCSFVAISWLYHRFF